MQILGPQPRQIESEQNPGIYGSTNPLGFLSFFCFFYCKNFYSIFLPQFPIPYLNIPLTSQKAYKIFLHYLQDKIFQSTFLIF